MPTSARDRIRANIDALRTLQELRATGKAATAAQQQILAAWSAWGAAGVSELFDETRQDFTAQRAELRTLLDQGAYDAARRTSINAHYTDPAYVRHMWDYLRQSGFTAGDVLEPGSGSGNFMVHAPAGARLTGVELDPTTAEISRHLVPDATVRTESFADTRLPATFDAAIGNVPFGNIVLHDPRHNTARHSMHNHFILKALHHLKPGGTAALMTSAFTMDAVNPAARRQMHELAELVGAVRLPTGAHQRTAGTEALTDVLIFHRRTSPAPEGPFLWETTTTVEVDGEQGRINAYFAEHPAQVLGELRIGPGMYGAQTLRVQSRQDPGTTLSQALDRMLTRARQHELTHAPANTVEPARAAAQVPDATQHWDGHLSAHPDGSFTVVRDEVAEPLKVPGTQQAELRALLGLRDRARTLLEAEAATVEDTVDIDQQRAALAGAYTAYVDRYGPINRFTERRTGRTDDTGADIMARTTPGAVALVGRDPFGPLVKALEVFNDDTQEAAPAGLLRSRQVTLREPARGADTPAEALAITLDTHGQVDLDHIAALTGLDVEEVTDRLAGDIFPVPGTEDWQTRAEYLSGNVREKLDAATTVAIADPGRWQANVTALEAVLPEPLGQEDVQPRIGATWISAEDHRTFLSELLEDKYVQVDTGGGGVWEVKAGAWSVASTNEWGTERMPAGKIFKNLAEQRPIQVHDELDDGKRVLNPTATAAAQEKGQAMQERFTDWVWEDPARAARLLDTYNRRFNSLVLRDYAHEGDRLTLPGLSKAITPRPHQRAAVARMISEPAVGLFHEVGAGKTAEMVIGCMELKRLGMVNKPAVVVPNHMLEQFGREWLQLYPQARILAASSKDLAGDKRREFVARAAANDWDAVIMTRTAFQRVSLTPETEAKYLQKEVGEARQVLQEMSGERNLTTKRLEKALLGIEERMKAKLDQPSDPGISFENTGIDYLAIDELHDYKNLATASNIRDAAIEGSQRASDLHAKLDYLRETHGERVVTGATATPLANSVTELYVMQRYLRPDLLTDAGIDGFDAWAATFGQTVTEMELAPARGSFRQKTRFAKFQNVPELLKMFHVFADVKTAEDLKLPVPDLAERPDGVRAPEMVAVEATEELRTYVADLGERAEQVASRAVAPDEDNMLKITSDGRAAALDMRLVDPFAGSQPEGKVAHAADLIAQVWRETRENIYIDPESGEESPVRGALQIVFCDLSTPGTDKPWNAYDDLKAQLVDRGMPAEAIRFVHEARNEQEKARLFASCRNGAVSVLIGSTQKMGVGTNIQDRAVHLVDLDAPWRPADIQQRHGRIVRQGNQNPKVRISQVTTKDSFDAYMWSALERKSKFINQIMRGSLDVREIEDIGDNTLNFAQAKAITSGNPLILEKANADAERTRLERIHRSWSAGQRTLRATAAAEHIAALQVRADVPVIRQAAAAARTTAGDAFAMTIDGRRYAERSEAGDALAQAVRREVSPYSPPMAPKKLNVAIELGGHRIVLADLPALNTQRQIQVSVADVPRTASPLNTSRFTEGGVGVIRTLENKLAGLNSLADRVEVEAITSERSVVAATDRMHQPFKYETQLDRARAECTRIDQTLAEQANDQAHAAHSEATAAVPTEPAAEQATPGPPVRPAGHPKQPVTARIVDRPAPHRPWMRPATAGPDREIGR